MISLQAPYGGPNATQDPILTDSYALKFPLQLLLDLLRLMLRLSHCAPLRSRFDHLEHSIESSAIAWKGKGIPGMTRLCDPAVDRADMRPGRR